VLHIDYKLSKQLERGQIGVLHLRIKAEDILLLVLLLLSLCSRSNWFYIEQQILYLVGWSDIRCIQSSLYESSFSCLRRFKAATSVVATGVLVCNCVDEFRLDV